MRASGILMPIFSLPSSYGIGTFGKSAFEFVDFLIESGQTYWQILPLNPTSFGDSPYQSFSSFAGNPYFVDLDLLKDDGLINSAEIEACDFGDNSSKIDYEKLYLNRYPLLRKAFARFVPDNNYYAFIKENYHWIDEYALYMAIKDSQNSKAFYEWDDSLKSRNDAALNKAKENYIDDIKFYKFLQFKFFEQWSKLKNYANKNGIKIIGDIPIYVALDSADVWSNPKQFQLKDDYTPRAVAGVPPDAFSEDGQLWGNPLYDWDYMKSDNYAWWKSYLKHALERYDVVRIDHFRGFESYFSIPYGDKNAKNGKWVKGPDVDLFNTFKAEFGNDLPIIAEDLGVITPAVKNLLSATDFPGMKVLQFAFSVNNDNAYLPHNIIKKCVVYTGTHDNDTIMGWLHSATSAQIKQAKNYLNHQSDDGFNWAMIKAALGSVADTCIIPMADFLSADSRARINTPSTLENNWCWRIDSGCINPWLANIIKENVTLYGRDNTL